MSHPVQPAPDAHVHDAAGVERHGAHISRRGYIVGFLLSAVLTAIPFWLVMSGVLADAQATAIAIMVAAVAQILVHTVCFLHVNAKAEGGWTLLAYLFTAVIVVIAIGGSLWIMYHLNANMMPMDGTVLETL